MEELLTQILSELKQQNQTNLIFQKQLLTYQEACLYTSLSYSYLSSLVSKGEIPVHKPAPKLVYIERDILDRWMKGELNKPQPLQRRKAR